MAADSQALLASRTFGLILSETAGWVDLWAGQVEITDRAQRIRSGRVRRAYEA